MNADAGVSMPQTPQLRALLFTDLCDSTTLVERIGDVAAAELFQQHDRLVMGLQQRWNGRLIDRSDGLFLVFERPIDALGFALAYHSGLQVLGQLNEAVLVARAGIHVGEVILWKNDADAIALGAKSVEVEGLVKPMAARLMQLALPGQILVSAAAEGMMRRVTGSLGRVAESLVWQSHGRWRFKGTAHPMEVFSVHGPDMPSPGRPRTSAKAVRVVAFWRQPVAMAAQATLLLALVVGVWFFLRPQPAIAFAERDWVVLGDLRNLTQESLLDDSLQQAFRISLEQSRHVNVISDLKARSVLGQMRRSPDALLDGPAAAEVAQRVGARLMLMPTIAEVGGRLRLSVEIVDPQSRRTLAVASSEGRGLSSVLSSTDAVTSQLREQLGEASARVEAASSPLPAVTTDSLDALRAYALGQARYSRGDYAGALAMYDQATELDPEFALAWMAKVRAYFANAERPAALRALEQANRRSGRLPPREALYLAAWNTSLTDQGRGAESWRRLAMLYPDYFAVQHNAALWLYGDNRFVDALEHARRAADPRFELSNVAQDQLGRIQLALGNADAARRAFGMAIEGGRGASHRYLGAVEASQRNFDKALRELENAAPSRHVVVERVSIAADQGDWSLGVSQAKEGLDQFARSEGFDLQLMELPLATALWGEGNRAAAARQVRATIKAALHRLDQSDYADAGDDAMLALGAALLAVRLGDVESARTVAMALRDRPDLLRQPLKDEMVAVVDAALARHRRDPQAALTLLAPYLTEQARFQTRVMAMDALNDLGRTREAREQAEFLARNRGLAYAELDCGYCLQTLNVADSNRAAVLAARLRSVGPPQMGTIKVP